MTSYKNLNGNSNVKSFEIETDLIKIQFGSGSPYIYSYKTAGVANVEQAKMLAQRGYGLNSYIMRHMKYLYEK